MKQLKIEKSLDLFVVDHAVCCRLYHTDLRGSTLSQSENVLTGHVERDKGRGEEVLSVGIHHR